MVGIFHVNVDIEDMLEMHEVIFEVYIKDQLTNRQQMQAPKQMLIANFVETAKRIKTDTRPIKFKMIKPEIIWDNIEQKQNVLYNELEISNDAMIAYEETNRGD